MNHENAKCYPELPESLRGGKLFPLLRFFGPGAIIASVTIGSGETVFASRGGAIFGNIDRGRRWLRAPLVDTVGSFACVVLFTMAFMILGATLLHPNHIVPSGLQLLSVQADFLTQMHANLLFVYQAGVFIAFFGTILGAYELYVRTTHECLRPVSIRVRQMSISQLRPWVVAYCGIGGILIMWLGGNPVQIVTPAAILGGVFTCGLWCLLMVWTDRRFLPESLQMGKPLVILNIASGLFLTGWGIRGIIDFVGAL